MADSPSSSWRLLASWGTLITGLLTVAVFALSLGWASALGLVVLLYVHELGHLLAARWRGLTVRRAPLFIPGLGAFVAVENGEASVWDEVLLSLAGPVLGTVAALMAKRVGMTWNLPALAYAGNLGLIVNLVNLLPFSPLDGGRISLLTGWLGLIPTVLLGIGVLYAIPDPILMVLAVVGIWQAIRAIRSGRRTGFGTSLAILAIHLTVVLTFLVILVLSGSVRSVSVHLPSYLPTTWQVANVLFWAVIASQFLLPMTTKPGVPYQLRYAGLALFGWVRALISAPGMIPVYCCMAAQAFGLPGMRWLEGLIRRHAGREPLMGSAAGNGYDFWVRAGQPEAATAWAGRVGPVLSAAGGLAMSRFTYVLLVYGYHRVAQYWLDEWLRREPAPAPWMPAEALNQAAWTMVALGRPQPALPFARAALTSAPQDGDVMDTLGRVLVETGAPTEAEGYLRAAMAKTATPHSQVFLARALADQGRYAEAVAEAESALQYRAVWPTDLPGREAVQSWVEAWRNPVILPQ